MSKSKKEVRPRDTQDVFEICKHQADFFLTKELGLCCRLVANPYDVALIESLAVAIKFLCRNSAAYRIALSEKILSPSETIQMDESENRHLIKQCSRKTR